METELELRLCNVCEQELPVSDFYRHISYKDGIARLCKACHNERGTKNRERRKREEKAIENLASALKSAGFRYADDTPKRAPQPRTLRPVPAPAPVANPAAPPTQPPASATASESPSEILKLLKEQGETMRLLTELSRNQSEEAASLRAALESIEARQALLEKEWNG